MSFSSSHVFWKKIKIDFFFLRPTYKDFICRIGKIFFIILKKSLILNKAAFIYSKNYYIVKYINNLK